MFVHTEDTENPNHLRMFVHRIRKNYAPLPKGKQASSVQPQSPRFKAELGSGDESVAESRKKPPKYVLAVLCKDFLDTQSWTTRFKDMIDGAGPTPAQLSVWDGRSHSGVKLRTLPSQATGMLQTQTKIPTVPLVCPITTQTTILFHQLFSCWSMFVWMSNNNNNNRAAHNSIRCYQFAHQHTTATRWLRAHLNHM